MREAACQFWALQKPHKSPVTHIKQSGCHRGCVGCSINLLVAAWMGRFHCSWNHTYMYYVKLRGLAERWFPRGRRWCMTVRAGLCAGRSGLGDFCHFLLIQHRHADVRPLGPIFSPLLKQQMWFLWYVRDDWSVILSAWFTSVLIFQIKDIVSRSSCVTH